MALSLPKLTLSSGVELTNPVFVIQDLSLSGSKTVIDRVDNASSVEGQAGAYELNSTAHEGESISYYVMVFANKKALTDAKPAVDYLKDGHSKYLFNFNKQDPDYINLTPRNAAYAHLKSHADFSAATEVTGVNF